MQVLQALLSCLVVNNATLSILIFPAAEKPGTSTTKAILNGQLQQVPAIRQALVNKE